MPNGRSGWAKRGNWRWWNRGTVTTIEGDAAESDRSGQTKFEGIAKDLPVIGHWKSKDGDVFYLVIGSRLDKMGEVVQTEANE